MVKSKILIERKDVLLSQLREIEAGIAEETRQLDDQNLNEFIQKGILKSEDGHKIQQFTKQKNSLLAVQKGLDRSIYIARRKEREKEVQKIEKEQKELKEKKEELLKKIRRRLEEIEELRKESRKFLDPLIIIKQNLQEKQKPQKVVHFKLREVEDFLAKHYIKYPEKIREAVVKEVAVNKEAFTPGVKPAGHSRTIVYGGFEAVIEKDSGVCELKHPENSGWSVDLAAHNPIPKAACLGQEVKK